MEKHWIRRAGNDKLVVFVLGWAADHRVVEHIVPAMCDVLCLYDYRSIEPLTCDDIEEIESYSDRYLFAWSFGVWVAEQLFADISFARAVALNGTPFPVSERYGIALRRLDVTIRGLRNGGLDEFNRRTYGESYVRLKDCLSPRGIECSVEELCRLKELSVGAYIPQIRWDKAIVGEDDLIFSPENMKNYWGERAELLPLVHYPFADADLILREIDYR